MSRLTAEEAFEKAKRFVAFELDEQPGQFGEYWLFASRFPAPGDGPVSVNAETGEVEEYGSAPESWPEWLLLYSTRKADD